MLGVAPRLEQWIRCSRMAALARVHAIHPDDLSTASLWRGIDDALQVRAPHHLSLRFSGLDVVSDLVRASHEMRTAIGA